MTPSLLERDVNHPSYFIMDGDHRQPVHFEALTEADTAELIGPSWSKAIFHLTWPHFVGDPSVFKLVSTENDEVIHHEF